MQTSLHSKTLLSSLSVVASAVALTACGGPVDEQPEQSETRSDAINPSMVGFSKQYLIVGKSVDIEYTGQPRFLEIRTIFTSATAGVHPVTVEPLDDHGDAALWITDGAFTNLAISRPTNSRSAKLDFEFVSTWPENQKIVIRDEAEQPAKFRVSLGAPTNPENPDPDEGDPVGGKAPSNLAGKQCDGVVGIYSVSTMYDYKGDVAQQLRQPYEGLIDFTTKALVVSESKIQLTTLATYSAARDLHRVAVGSFSEAPTQMTWDIPAKRIADGSIVGDGSIGAAKVNVVVGATQMQLSFSGKISQPWNGNTQALQVSATGKIPLSACAPTQPPPEPTESSCCATSTKAGCAASAAVQSCVCAQDSFCCDSSWDQLCVDEVESFGCGSCP